MRKIAFRSLFLLSCVGFNLRSQTDCISLVKGIYNPDSCISRIENCISGPFNDTSAYVKSSCYLANLYSKKSQFVKAEKILSGLFKMVNGNNKKLLKGMVHNYLANNYKLSRDLSLALQNFLVAETIFENEKSNPDLIRLFTDIAEYYRSIGQQIDAKRYIKKALDLYDASKLNDIPKLIRIYNRFGAISNESSNNDSCMLFSIKALNLSRQIGDFNSEAISLNEIGFAMKNRRKVDSSAKCFRRAIYLWNKIGDDMNAVHAKYNLAMLYSHNYFPKDTIIPLYKDIIKIVNQKKIDYPLDQVYFGLSDCYFFAGDSLDCYRIRRKAFEALIDKNRKMYDLEVNNIKEKYENQKYQRQISKVSDELETSEKRLTQKKRENQIIYWSLAILALLIIVIGFLARRVYLTNKILNSKNREKDTLIQEIHHRVKNNLQFVSSLINMQINSSKTGLEIDSLNDASRRIRSMALVHEMLYNQNNMDGIEIKRYLEELVSSINDIVNSRKIPIRFIINCEEFIFETPNAIALGMITSELVSNSIKYAFGETENPQINIDLKKLPNDDKIGFELRDNGKGLSEPGKDMPEKLGMRLINIFSRQIKGEYSFKNDGGLVYTLMFQNKFKK